MPKQKYSHYLGLAGTGWVSKSFLPGLPFLGQNLGPVYTPTKRVTPRITKALGAGYPVASLEELTGCRNLIVCADDTAMAPLIEEMATQGVLDGVDLLVMVEAGDRYRVPDEAAALVREAGYLSQLPFRRNPTYLVEGTLRLRRFSQMLLAVPLRRLVLSSRESRALVNAALLLSGELCLPLLEAAQSCFVHAGVPEDHARELSAALLGEAVENARFAGKKRWNGVLSGEDGEKFRDLLEALQCKDEALAGTLQGFAETGLCAMKRSNGWLRRKGESRQEQRSGN